MEKVLLIGAGALARDIVEGFGADAFVATFVDPGYDAVPVQGLPMVRDWESTTRVASHYVLGVLDREHRRRAQEQARRAGLIPASPMISSAAKIAADCRIARGCLVGHFVVLGPACRLQEDVLVMHSAVVAHDVVINNSSVVLPGAVIGGEVQVGADCFIGANASLVPRIAIDDGCHVAAGAVCFRSCAAGSTLLGNPARVVRRSPGQEQ